MALSASAIVKVAGSSDISKLILVGTWLYNLSPSTDIAATRLLAVGVSGGSFERKVCGSAGKAKSHKLENQ